MMKRRSNIERKADILKVLKVVDIRLTKMMLRVNMSHTKLRKSLRELEAANLVRKGPVIQEGRGLKGSSYYITPTGREAIKWFEAFAEIVEPEYPFILVSYGGITRR